MCLKRSFYCICRSYNVNEGHTSEEEDGDARKGTHDVSKVNHNNINTILRIRLLIIIVYHLED